MSESPPPDDAPLFTQKLIGFRGWSVEWLPPNVDWNDPATMRLHAEIKVLKERNQLLGRRYEDARRELAIKEEALRQATRLHYGYSTSSHTHRYSGVASGHHGGYINPGSMYDDYEQPQPREPGLWTHSDTYWHPGKPARARCKARRYGGGLTVMSMSLLGGKVKPTAPKQVHRSPDPLCTCGLHAHYDLASTGYASMEPEAGWVIGAVAAWGRVEAHSQVFRAEYMEPVALGIDTGAPPLLMQKMERLAQMYAVDLVPLQDLAEHATKFGTPIPQEYRGRPKAPGEGPPPEPGTFQVQISADATALRKQLSAQIGQQGVAAEKQAKLLARAFRKRKP